MRILIFHGYLLRGTGSNVYTDQLARTLAELGHEVHLFCQDRYAYDLDYVDAAGWWEGGNLRVSAKREPAGLTVYTPDIGRVLPVYVADEYEGFEARVFSDLDPQALEHYLERNVSAVREVAGLNPPDAALANHLVMGPVILGRALSGIAPYAVKVHGSALEYTVRPNRQRFLPFAHEGLSGAVCVLAGSRHIARRLWETVDISGLEEKTRLSTPGVDTKAFHPRTRQSALDELDRIQASTKPTELVFGRDSCQPAISHLIDRQSDRLVAFVGKMIPAKGLEMLVGAWPYVVARIPDARLCVAGFGSLRPRLEKLCEALADADLRGLQAVAAGSGPEQELSYLQAFIAGLGGSSRRLYLDWAPYAAGRINFLGRLEHSELAPLLSACEALVVPSTFFEAFGMVACEAAACGALPVCAAHSGLYEVVETLQSALDSDLAALMSFELGPESVSLIADKLGAWLSLDLDRQRIARQRLAENAHSRYGLTQVAQRVASACLGVTDGLARP